MVFPFSLLLRGGILTNKTKRDIKVIFYKSLLDEKRWGHLSITTKTVYSLLVQQSIYTEDCIFDSNGDIDFSIIEDEDVVELPIGYVSEQSGWRCFCYGNKISKYIGVSQQSVSNAIKVLRTCGILNEDKGEIYHCDIYKNGFFPIIPITGIGMGLRIFYSWLLDLQGEKEYIYANARRLAEMYNTTLPNINMMIKRLKDKGLVSRDEKGNLLLNKII